MNYKVTPISIKVIILYRVELQIQAQGNGGLNIFQTILNSKVGLYMHYNINEIFPIQQVKCNKHAWEDVEKKN